jgi:hypothetical protein
MEQKRTSEIDSGNGADTEKTSRIDSGNGAENGNPPPFDTNNARKGKPLPPYANGVDAESDRLDKIDDWLKSQEN